MITIEQWACYAPYRVRLQRIYRSHDKSSNKPVDAPIKDGILVGIDENRLLVEGGNLKASCKPYLYPMSMLTSVIVHKGVAIIPIVELAKIGEQQYFSENNLRVNDGTKVAIGCGWNGKDANFVFAWNTENKGFYLESKPQKRLIIANQVLLFQKLFEWHFDVFGLLDKNLAIEKTNIQDQVI